MLRQEDWENSFGGAGESSCLGHGKCEMLAISEEMLHTVLYRYIWASEESSGLEVKLWKKKWLMD